MGKQSTAESSKGVLSCPHRNCRAFCFRQGDNVIYCLGVFIYIATQTASWETWMSEENDKSAYCLDG